MMITLISVWIAFLMIAFMYGSFALSERFLHYSKAENLKRFCVILKSILIFSSILLIAYTIYFVYTDVWFPPYGCEKGCVSIIMNVFDCSYSFGCGIKRLIYEYFDKLFFTLLFLPSFFGQYLFQMLMIFLVSTWSTVYFYQKYKDE